MVRKALASALILFFLPLEARAHVTVLSPHWNCQELLLRKSLQGRRTSLESDATDRPVENLSEAAYTLEALTEIEVVRSVYAEIFRKRGMSSEESTALLAKFALEDAARARAVPGHNGLDNTVYFVRRSSQTGGALGILRATLIKQGESRRLTLENQVPVPARNRVEFERFYNAGGPYADVVSSEIMLVAAKFLRDYFGNDDYGIYLLTDAVRARRYRSHYAFETTVVPRLDEMYRYFCHSEGSAFYDRYLGHIERAYAIAFRLSPYGFGKNQALELLRDYERQPGMHDYIENLVAQSVILAAHRDYAGALALSDHLKAIGETEINEDYHTLWKSRSLYDPIQRTGDAAKSLATLHEYLARKPLELNRYNDRTLLFLIFEIKILLATENLEKARALVLSHQTLIREGRAKLRPLYLEQWNLLASYAPRNHPASLRARRIYIELTWDLGTHKDPYATSVLYPETWGEMARICEAQADTGAASYYRKIENFWRALP